MKYPAYPEYKESGIEWLGEVPEHWETNRIKYISSIVGRIGFRGYSTDDLVGEGDGAITLSPSNCIEGKMDFSKCTYLSWDKYDESPEIMVNEEDIIMVKTGSTIGKTAIVDSVPHPMTINPQLVIFKGVKQSKRFLFHYLYSKVIQDLIPLHNTGSTIPTMTQESIGRLYVPIPPVFEQRTIVDFLDTQTAKIHALLAKKRELLDKLKEKRTALISRTVTRGLPPDAARAAGLDPHPPMKDSGIEWLGEVPEHWEVLPFTKYLAEKSDYRGKTPEKMADGVFLVTAKNVRMGYIDYEVSQEFVSVDDYDEIMRRGLPKVGDVLFTTEAPLGNIALVDREDIALAQRIIRFRLDTEFFLDRFVLYAMMSDFFQNQLQSLSTGSTAEGLKASKLYILKIIKPPLIMQRTIADFLDHETEKIDRMVAKIEQAIERLQEYRTALITAAVTGKIDVRGGAA